MKYYIVTILAAFSIASVAQANGYGIKLDKAVGEYIVNVDADTYILTAGEPIRFNFELWNKDRTDVIDSDNVWVRITKEGSFASLFAGQIDRPDFGGMGMTYFFSKAGNYTISVRFQKAGEVLSESLAEASFGLVVEGDAEGTTSQSNTRNSVSWVIIGLIVGAAIVFFLKTPKKEISKKMLIGTIAAILVLVVAIWLLTQWDKNPKATSPTQQTLPVSQPPQPAPPQ